MKLLNLSCGNCYHNDWINIDFHSNTSNVISYNLNNGIPFENDSLDVVYHSHILEHFTKNDGFIFMQECYRVLKPQGIIRVAVPNLEVLIQEYTKNINNALEGNQDAKDNYEWIMIELFDQMVRNETGGEMLQYLSANKITNENYVYSRIGHEGKLLREFILTNSNNHTIKELKTKKQTFTQKAKDKIKLILKNLLFREDIEKFTNLNKALTIGQFRLSGEVHQWMYDRYSLTKLMNDIGFANISIVNAYTSNIHNWEKYKLDVLSDNSIRKPDSLFIEARK